MTFILLPNVCKIKVIKMAAVSYKESDKQTEKKSISFVIRKLETVNTTTFSSFKLSFDGACVLA